MDENNYKPKYKTEKFINDFAGPKIVSSLKNKKIYNKFCFLMEIFKTANLNHHIQNNLIKKHFELISYYATLSDIDSINYLYKKVFSFENSSIQKVTKWDIENFSDFFWLHDHLSKELYAICQNIENYLTYNLFHLSDLVSLNFEDENEYVSLLNFSESKNQKEKKEKLLKVIESIINRKFLKIKDSNINGIENHKKRVVQTKIVLRSLTLEKKITLFKHINIDENYKIMTLFGVPIDAITGVENPINTSLNFNEDGINLLKECNKIRNWISHHEFIFDFRKLDTIEKFYLKLKKMDFISSGIKDEFDTSISYKINKYLSSLNSPNKKQVIEFFLKKWTLFGLK